MGGESDRLIVLRAWESHVQGEGVGEVTQPTKETSPGQVEPIHEANLPVGNSEEGGIGQGPSLPESHRAAERRVPTGLLEADQQTCGLRCRPSRRAGV